jgi:hypothetical protein
MNKLRLTLLAKYKYKYNLYIPSLIGETIINPATEAQPDSIVIAPDTSIVEQSDPLESDDSYLDDEISYDNGIAASSYYAVGEELMREGVEQTEYEADMEALMQETIASM